MLKNLLNIGLNTLLICIIRSFMSALGYVLMWCDIYFSFNHLTSCLVFFFLASRDPELKNNKAVLISVWVSAINVSPEDLDDEMSGLDLQNTQMCRPWLEQKGYE